MVLRIGFLLPLAALITFALFYFMQSLIATGDQLEPKLLVYQIADPLVPVFDPVVIKDIDRPEPIDDPPPPDPTDDPRPNVMGEGPGIPSFRPGDSGPADVLINGTPLAATDGDYLPLVRVPPQYPARAAQNGIEGWVLLEFTVDERGNVLEDSIVVIDSEPPGIFDRSSTRAVARFKYQPRVDSGIGIAVPGVQTILRYELAQD